MAWRIAVACLVLAALARGASGNGRSPGTSTIAFRQGDDNHIAVGLTFGLLISRDGGASWQWICEDAVGYTGAYDPSFAFSASGALFASTFNGLKVMRDGCTFDGMPSGSTFVSNDTLGPDRALYFAASQAADPPHGIVGDFHIYRSSDDGRSFPLRALPAAAVNWWQSLRVAPSDPLRVYLAGYRYVAAPTGADTLKQQLLYRSDDGGASWIELSTADFEVMPNSVIDIMGIARDTADRVYARVTRYDNSLSDAIYRSTDKGASWTRIRQKPAPIGAFLVRSNGDLLLGTQALGAEISRNDGVDWAPLAGAPHMNCLAENAAGEVWACTQNYGSPSIPSDDAGIMKTTDLATWTRVLRYQDLRDPVSCPAGTVQHDTCTTQWCAVCAQLGCTPPASYGCAGGAEVVPPPPPPPRAGCCDVGSGAGGALALGALVATVLLRPRREP